MQILGTVLNIIFVITSILLILLILLQSGRSSGMALFGGSGSQSAFGANSADVLTKATAILVAVFMLTGFGMALAKKNSNNYKKIQEKITGDAGSDALPVEGAENSVTGTADVPAENPAPAETQPNAEPIQK